MTKHLKFNGGKDEPGSAPQARAKVAQTYQYMYERAFRGNRAPVLISNHFNTWNGDLDLPGMSGDSGAWEAWSHVRRFDEAVPVGVEAAGGADGGGDRG